MDGLVTDWNQGASRLYGYVASEMLGQPLARLLPPERAWEPPEIASRIQRGERLDPRETVHLRKGGRPVEVSLSISPIKDSSGRLTGLSWVSRDVSTQRRTEKALRETVERFKGIYEVSPIGIEIYDAEGTLIDANKACLDIFGVDTVEQIKGFPLFEDPNVSESVKAMLRSGQTARYEALFDFEKVKTPKLYETSRSGAIWLDVLITPLTGEARGYLVHVQDVTEQKNAEDAARIARDELERRVEERTAALAAANEQLRKEITEHQRTEQTLRESEARFRKLFEQVPLGMAIVGPDYRFLRVNDMTARILGYSPEELLQLKFTDVTYPEDIPLNLQVTEQLFRGEIPYLQFEKRYVRKDKEIIWVIVTASVMRDADGKPLHTISTIQDITERKRAEQERERLLSAVEQLAETARRRAGELETTIASIVDAVLVVDNQGRIVDINEAGLRLFGLARKEDAVRPALEYLRQLDLRLPDGSPIEQRDLGLTRALAGQIVRGLEVLGTDRHSKRDIHLLVSAAPIRERDHGIAGAVEVISDITRMRELDKLKDEFISVAAHELKTPISIMKGYAQAMLRAGENLPATQRRMLDAINRGSDRIDRVVKDLLDISRLHTTGLEVTLERIDLPELVTEVVDRMTLTTAKHHLRVVHAEPVVVRGDRDRLEQVLVNLIENAVKYSPKGGDVDVSVVLRDNKAIVSVKDRGVGIAQDKQRNIFQRFYTAHTGTPYDYGGMGVGLYISREIVHRHGGEVWFESKEEEGSTFYFSLPLE